MRDRLFRKLESRWNKMFREHPEITLSEIPLRVTREPLYEFWYDADEALEELNVQTWIGAFMCRLQARHGTLDTQIETFEDSCLFAQALAVELSDIAVQQQYGSMRLSGKITYSTWLYMEAVYNRAANPFELAFNSMA